MTDPLATLIVRAGQPGDWNRVRKDWIGSMSSSDLAHLLTRRDQWEQREASDVYYAWQRAVVERLLARAELVVASWAEDIRSIVGWAVFERPRILHYVHVGGRRLPDSDRPAYRRLGIARRLLEPFEGRSDVIYTHRSTTCRHLPIPPSWLYDPRPALDGAWSADRKAA